VDGWGVCLAVGVDVDDDDDVDDSENADVDGDERCFANPFSPRRRQIWDKQGPITPEK
jgi:hypothetical protein